MIKWISGIAAVIFIVMGIQVLWSDKQEIAKKQKEDRELPLILKGVDLRQYLQAELDYKVLANEAHLYRASNRLEFKGFDASVSTSGQGDLQIQADSGNYTATKSLLALQDNVRIQHPEQAVITCDNLYFNTRNKQLYNRGPVAIRHHDYKIDGADLDYDIKTGDYSMTKPVARMVSSEKLSGDHLEFSQQKRRLAILGNSRIDLPVKKATIQGKRLDVLFNQEKKIDYLQFVDRVELNWLEKDLRMKGRMMKFEPIGQVVTAQGDVQLEYRKTLVESGSIRLSLQSQEAIILASHDKKASLVFNPDNAEQESRYGISAGTIRFSLPGQSILLNDQVWITNPAEAMEFQSDHAEIYLDKESQPYEIYAYGNFKMTQQLRKSSADSARIYLDTRKLLLRGNARVEDTAEDLSIQSDKIEMSMELSKGFIRGDKQPVKIKIPLPE